MTSETYEKLSECVGDISNSSDLVYQLASSLNTKEGMDTVSAQMLEGALMALAKHLAGLVEEIDEMTRTNK